MTSGTSWRHTGGAADDQNWFYNVKSYNEEYVCIGNRTVGKASPKLAKGWNFINIPLDYPDMPVGDLAAELDSHGMEVAGICRWGGSGWDTWISPLYWMNNYSLSPGDAVMVWTDVPGTWYPEGNLLSSSRSQQINVGWNAISAPVHTSSTKTALDIYTQVEGQVGAGAVTYILQWNGEGWDVFWKGAGVDFELDAPGYTQWANGRSWFLYSSKEGVWVPE